MSFMDELKKLTRPYDDDGALEDEMDDLDGGLNDIPYSRTAPQPQPQVQPQPQPQPQPQVQPQQPVSNPITMGGMSGMGTMGDSMSHAPVGGLGGSFGAVNGKQRVVLCTPKDNWTEEKIYSTADYFINGASVILNFQGLKDEKAQVLYNFYQGCVYAMGGDLKTAADDVYIMIPKNVELESDASGKDEDKDEDEA